MGMLWYAREKIAHATIRVVFKLMAKESDSGVFIRIPDRPTEPWMPINRGYEVEIGDWPDDYSCTGVLYTFTKALARPLKPEGEWRTVTYMACGLVSDPGKDATAFTSQTQTILARLIDQVVAHGGTIERAGGDGFSAFWNAPLDDVEHELHACEAANAMALAIAEAARYEPPVLINVGIATGPVVAGGFGGHGHMTYGVQGDAVLLAHKIRALTRHYNSPLIVTEQTRRLAERNFGFLEIDTVTSAPNKPPTPLYALMGGVMVRASPKFRALAVFHDHIFQAIRKQNWRVARDLIAQCRRLSGANQALYDLHLARIAYYERNPPGEMWDGAFRSILE